MKTRYSIYSFLLILCLLYSGYIFAQEETSLPMFEHKIVAGFNLGATAPCPIPAEVRKIDGLWPMFTPQLGYNITYNYKPNWAVTSGILLDYKGMGVRDKVKYMYTSVVLDENDNKMEGYFVGRNETRIKTAYVTIPLYFVYRPNEIWSFKLGGYASYRFSAEFEGEVWDGYMRVETMDGSKFDIKDKGDARFNFGDDMRKFDLGLSVGAERSINERFGVFGNLSWGLTPVFHSSYRAIDFNMYNIYLALGMTYKLK